MCHFRWMVYAYNINRAGVCDRQTADDERVPMFQGVHLCSQLAPKWCEQPLVVCCGARTEVTPNHSYLTFQPVHWIDFSTRTPNGSVHMTNTGAHQSTHHGVCGNTQVLALKSPGENRPRPNRRRRQIKSQSQRHFNHIRPKPNFNPETALIIHM